MVKKLYLIGIGPGDPKYLTLEAYELIKRLKLFLVPDKREDKIGLTEIRLKVINFVKEGSPFEVIFLNFPERKKGTHYRAKVEEWRKEKAKILIDTLRELNEEEVGFLVIGDPAIYDGHIEIFHEVEKVLSLEWEVIPGLSSYQVLASREKLSLTEIATPLHFHTPRTLRSLETITVPTVVFLDNYETFKKFKEDTSLSIHWGAFVGSEKEVTISGKLSSVSDKISGLRRRLKKDQGYLLEIYYLKPQKTNFSDENKA